MASVITCRDCFFISLFVIKRCFRWISNFCLQGTSFVYKGKPFYLQETPFSFGICFILPRSARYTPFYSWAAPFAYKRHPFYLQETPFSLGICYIRPCYASYASYAYRRPLFTYTRPLFSFQKTPFH
mgnify:CR=1 FL=1